VIRLWLAITWLCAVGYELVDSKQEKETFCVSFKLTSVNPLLNGTYGMWVARHSINDDIKRIEDDSDDFIRAD
jgi:hypothetical protein